MGSSDPPVRGTCSEPSDLLDMLRDHRQPTVSILVDYRLSFEVGRVIAFEHSIFNQPELLISPSHSHSLEHSTTSHLFVCDAPCGHNGDKIREALSDYNLRCSTMKYGLSSPTRHVCSGERFCTHTHSPAVGELGLLHGLPICMAPLPVSIGMMSLDLRQLLYTKPEFFGVPMDESTHSELSYMNRLGKLVLGGSI